MAELGLGRARLPPSLLILRQITVGSAGASPWAASRWSDQALDLLSATPVHCCCRFCCARKSSGRASEVLGSSRAAAADGSQEASAPGHRDGLIRSPASYPTRAIECQSSEVCCRPAGARKGRAGDDRSFLAWGLRDQPTTCRPIRVLVARARSKSSKGHGNEAVEDVFRDE